MFGVKLNKINISNSHPLEVVGRGSEPQLQVLENLKKKSGIGDNIARYTKTHL